MRGVRVGALLTPGPRLVHQETSEWLVAATEALPTVVLPSERQRFLHEVLDANSGSRDSVSYSFRELGRLCRQRADPLERSRSPSQPAE